MPNVRLVCICLESRQTHCCMLPLWLISLRKSGSAKVNGNGRRICTRRNDPVTGTAPIPPRGSGSCYSGMLRACLLWWIPLRDFDGSEAALRRSDNGHDSRYMWRDTHRWCTLRWRIAKRKDPNCRLVPFSRFATARGSIADGAVLPMAGCWAISRVAGRSGLRNCSGRDLADIRLAPSCRRKGFPDSSI